MLTATATTGGLTTAILSLNSSGFMGLLTVIPRFIIGMVSYARNVGLATLKTVGFANVLNFLNINPIMLAISALTLVIGGVALAINQANKSAEEARQKAEEAISTYSQAQDTLQQNKQTLNSISSDFEKLSKGVDENGNNVSLTTEEYNKYHDVVNQIADMFPELIKGYDDEGNAILTVKGNVEALTQAYKDKVQAARDALIQENANGELDKKFEEDTTTSYSFKAGAGETTVTFTKTKDIEQINKYIELIQKAKQEFNDTGKISEKVISDIQSVVTGSGTLGKEASEYIKGVFESDESFIDKVSNKIDTLKSKITTLRSEVDAAMRNERTLIGAYVFGNDDYNKLDESAKQIVENYINSVDKEFIDAKGGAAGAATWIEDNIVAPLNKIDSDVDFEALVKFKTQLNNGDCTPGEYQEKLNAILKLIENSPLLNDSQKDEIKKSINIAFGLNLDDDISYEQATQTIEEKLRNSAEASSKAAQEMQDEFGLGNVDLTIRPRVDWTEMKKAGHDVEEGSYSTVDSTSFSFGTDEGVLDVHVTPILPDGTVMSPTELADYVDKIVSQGGNILENDTKGIVLKVDQWDDLTEEDIENKTQKYKDYIKAADDWDIALHNAQASYYDSYGKNWNKTKSDFAEINKYISSLSLEDIKIAYKIVQASDSEMSLNELKNKIVFEQSFDIEEKTLPDIYNDIKDKAKLIATAEKEMSDNGVIATDTMIDLIDKGLATENQFTKTAKGFTLSKTVLQNLNDAALKSYKNDLDNAKKAANAVIEAEGGKALAISATTDEYEKQLTIKALSENKKVTKDFVGPLQDGWTVSDYTSEELEQIRKKLSTTNSYYESAKKLMNSISNDVKNSGSKSSSKNETAGDKALKAWEGKKKEWKHKLEMGQMSEADYHYTLHVNYKKYLKNYKETLDERRAMEEDWYKWQATNAQNTWNLNNNTWKHQLEMGEITEATYYATVKKYYKKILGSYKETLDQRRQIEEELHQWQITNAQNTWNEQNNNKKHALAMGKITEKQYYDWVKANYKKILGTYKETLDERRSIEEDYYNWVTEQETQRLELIQTKLDGAKSAIDDLLEEEIDRLNEQKDAVEKAYQAEIDALQEKNEEKEKEIDLEEKALALAKSRNQRTVMQYTSQGMRYVADKTEVKSAQKDYDDALLQQKIDYLEQQKENASQAFESQIEVYNQYKDLWQDAVDAQQKAQNKMYANTQLWANWEQAALQGNIDLLNNFIDKYNQASKNVELNAVKNGNSDLTANEVNAKYTLIPDVIDATKLQTAMADFKDSINTLINGNLKKITEEFNTSQNITTKATSNVFNGGITINKPISDVDSLSRAIIEKLPMYMSQYCGS